MSALVVLEVIAIAQVLFLAMLMAFMAVRRRYDQARRRAIETGRAAVAGPMRDWLVGDGSTDRLVAAFRMLPRASVLAYASLLARNLVPAGRRGELARALRSEPWIHRAIADAESRWWWRRVEAARALSIVAGPEDRALVQQLRDDPQPEVAVAAVASIPAVADADMINRELDRYATLTPIVRQYLLATLREIPVLVEPLLAARLRRDAEPLALAERVRLAASLDLPRALRAAVPLATHDHPAVRAAVAHALGRIPSDASVRALGTLLRDSSAAVREEAAASLGTLGSPMASPMLEAAMRDPAWLVRRRSGLALAQLGEEGRVIVRALRSDADPYVSSMATLVSGLTDGALLELTEN